MARAGMLVQLDGSQHRWLGADAPLVTLLAAIDDATGTVVDTVFAVKPRVGGRGHDPRRASLSLPISWRSSLWATAQVAALAALPRARSLAWKAAMAGSWRTALRAARYR